MKETCKAIARLHDHKGTLYVACHSPLPEDTRWAFRRAWQEIAWEVDENVEFVDVHSSDWDAAWSGRRFKSDWKP